MIPTALVRGSTVLHLGFVVWLGALLLLPAACGTGYEGSGYGGGNRTVVGLGGALRPKEDAYKATLTSDAVAATSRPNGLAPSVDLRREGLVPPVQNQRFNSCIGWSLGYYVMSSVWARTLRTYESGRFLDLTNPENWFSPDYIYSQRDTLEIAPTTRADPCEPDVTEATCAESDDAVGCMRPEQALGILVRQGCSKWTWMCGGEGGVCPSDDSTGTTLTSRGDWQTASIGAQRYRPRCYVRFGSLVPRNRGDHPGLAPETRAQMQAWLHEQCTPIAIVVRMREGWVSYRGENASRVVLNQDCYPPPTREEEIVEQRGVCLEATGEDLGGYHMMTVIGYDENFPSRGPAYPDLPDEKRGSFLIVNQWGTNWGDGGYMWIPYSELAKIWVAGYGIIGPNLKNPQGGGECVQDPVTGRYIDFVEEDDVPMNLNEACDELATTAINILTGKPGCIESQVVSDDVTHGVVAGKIGERNEAGQVDSADWYVFEVKEGVDVSLVVSGGLRTIVTDDELQRVNWNLDGGMRGHLCSPGCYFVKVCPSDEFVPDDDGIDYTLEITLTKGEPPTGDICGAKPMTAMPGGAALASGVTGPSATYWKYKVQTDGELVLELDDEDVAVVVYKGRTAESALPVAWTARAIQGPFGTNVTKAVLRLGGSRRGDIVWFAAKRYKWWACDDASSDYQFNVRPCSGECGETPRGRVRLPTEEKRFQVLRAWTYRNVRGSTQYEFKVLPLEGTAGREVRVCVRAQDETCPDTGLQLFVGAQFFGEVFAAAARPVQPASAGTTEVNLPIPENHEVFKAAGTRASYHWFGVASTSVHVEVRDACNDESGPCTNCAYEVRVEEWGVASSLPQELTKDVSTGEITELPVDACEDEEEDRAEMPDITRQVRNWFWRPHEHPDTQIDTGREFDGKEWFLIHKNNWNQPWYTWFFEVFQDDAVRYEEPALISRHFMLQLNEFCKDVHLPVIGNRGGSLAGVVAARDSVGAVGAAFRRLTIPAEQPDAQSILGDRHPTARTSGDVWLGLREAGHHAEPLTSYKMRIWNEATLENWSQDVRSEDSFGAGQHGSPTDAMPLTLGDGVLTRDGSVSSSDRRDWYKFTAEAGTVRVSFATNVTDPGVGLRVKDPSPKLSRDLLKTRHFKQGDPSAQRQEIEVVVGPNAEIFVLVEALFEDSSVVHGHEVPYTLKLTRK